jgi:very-short-patch-repair endonuclease
MVSTPPEQARWQAGVFTAAQARGAGFTGRQVRYRVSHGQWHRVVGRGLSVRPAPDSGWPAEMLATAAGLTWPDTVVGFRVAAALHGFPITLAEPPGPPTRPGNDHQEFSVHVFSRSTRRDQPGLVAHRITVPERQIVRHHAVVRITNQTRTAIDCLATLPAEAALDLYAWLTTHRRFDRPQLTAAIRCGTGRFGVESLRRLHRRTAGGAVSEAERRVHTLLTGARITGWVAGARVYDAAGLIGVVDLLFAAERVVIEVDGFRAHSGRDAFVRDRRRQNRLTAAGYIVLRYTWTDLTTRPTDLLDEIRTVLGRRERQGTGG